MSEVALVVDGQVVGRVLRAPYVATWKELASWAPYLPKDYAGIAYPDAQAYFEAGKAAIYPAGTWDISTFEAGRPAFLPTAYAGPAAGARLAVEGR